jgi:hypothetical protein
MQFSHHGRQCNPNTIFTEMQDELYHLNLTFTCMRSYKICIWGTELDSSKPSNSESDHAEPNLGLHCQIMWNLRSSEILCSAMWYFHTNVLGQPISPRIKGQEIPKRENGTMEINWHNYLLWEFVHHLITYIHEWMTHHFHSENLRPMKEMKQVLSGYP